jgi:hypothetical protein
MKTLIIKVFKEGEEFCAVTGPDQIDGVSGWGESEADAVTAWVRVWESMSKKAQDEFREQFGE